ncbi:unnamed protein product [Phytophthora fragariaefolia]|uniref:Unnamed protein product n=1 Tax=Phytophthora fragariaefolia TaxID=1490495 RepID=A0A9W7D2X5_9STRA|nr:unnamed protein product [Phytophthora fragariaefolia]
MTPVGAGRPTGEDLSIPDGRVGGARHGGLVTESLGTHESKKSSDRLLVVHARSGARNADKFADALRENSSATPVLVRLANGSLVEVPRVLMDLSAKFENFESTERFIVLEMDKYDLNLGLSWLEKHEPWIDWRGKAIGASRSVLSDRASVSHVPTSVKGKGIRQDRQGASAPEEFMGVAEVFGAPHEVPVDPVKESAEEHPGVKLSEFTIRCCGLGNLAPPEQGITRRDPGVGNVVPRGVRKALIDWKTGYTASNVGSLVPREPVKAKQEWKVGKYASRVGNIVPHKASIVDGARDETLADVDEDQESSDGHCQVIGSETGLRVKADAIQLKALSEVAELLNLEETSLNDFLADLNAGDIAEVVLLRPEPTPEELNSSSVVDEDVLEEFRN